MDKVKTFYQLFEQQTIDKTTEEDYHDLKIDLSRFMMKYYDLDRDSVMGIIEYENWNYLDNDDNYPKEEKEFVELKDIMPNFRNEDGTYNLKGLSDDLMKNDEGQYQLDIVESDSKEHPNYHKRKKKKEFNL